MPYKPQNLHKICTSYAYTRANPQSRNKINYAEILANSFLYNCRGSLIAYESCLGSEFRIRISLKLNLFF
jgi:hypothetical protein